MGEVIETSLSVDGGVEDRVTVIDLTSTFEDLETGIEVIRVD